jgi:hypothetical protein
MTGSTARPAATVTLLILGLAGCASAPPPAEVQSVTQSGIKFAESVPPVLNGALDAAIASNSDTLIAEHASASADAKKTALLEADSAYRERAKIFADVGNQAQLLRSYFVALAALGDTSADSAIGAEASALVNQMGELDKNIASYEIGGRSVASLTGSVTPLIVGAFRSAAVERELRAHGDDIVRTIELQRAFLQAVASDLRSELAAEQQQREFKSVIEPYLSSNPLPSNWKTLRANALAGGSQSQSVAALDAAASTAANLKTSFIAMAGGSRSSSLFAQLENDVDRLAALVKALEGTTRPAS